MTNWILYNLIGIAFRIGIKPFFDLEVEGLENYSETPSSLVVSNHKRDLDSVLVASILYYHNGFFKQSTPISFMANESLFQPGFLGHWIKGPRILKRILQPFSLRSVLHKLHAYPIGKLNFRAVPVNDALEIVKKSHGDRKLREVLKEDVIDQLFTQSSFDKPDMTISEFFEKEGYPRMRVKSSDFNQEFRKAVKRTKVRKVKDQLSKFVNLLNQGGILYITPEGTLSKDGRIGPMKDSLFILVEEADPEVLAVPVNITYDFMREGKTKIFVQLGGEIPGLDELDRKEGSKRIKRSLLSLTTINLSQIASYFLVKLNEEGTEEVNEAHLLEKIHGSLEKFEREGFKVSDELLGKNSFENRWESYVKYSLDRGIFNSINEKRDSRDRTIALSSDLGYNSDEISRGYRRDPLNYCANEIKDLIETDLISL